MTETESRNRSAPGSRRELGAVANYERRSEPMMFTLATASVPLLLLESTWSAASWLGWGIVAVFAADLSLRVLLAPAPRLRYLRSHWLDVLIVVVALLPLLRPLRMLKALQLWRLARLVLFAARAWRAARRIWGGVHGKALLGGCAVMGAVAVGVVYLSERAAPDSSIHSAETTLWWAVTTITTVGYGDTSPVTLEGRVAAAALMLVGISMFGLVTANVSARFVRKSSDAETRTSDCKVCAAQVRAAQVPADP